MSAFAAAAADPAAATFAVPFKHRTPRIKFGPDPPGLKRRARAHPRSA
jgi:hypothetical protein